MCAHGHIPTHTAACIHTHIQMCTHTHKFWSLFNVIDVFCRDRKYIHQVIKHPTSNPHKQILFTTFWRWRTTVHKIPTLAEQHSSGLWGLRGKLYYCPRGEKMKPNSNPSASSGRGFRMLLPGNLNSHWMSFVQWPSCHHRLTGFVVKTVPSLLTSLTGVSSPLLVSNLWMISGWHEYLALLQETMEKDFRQKSICMNS